MKIKSVEFSIWIDTEKGNQFDNCDSAEILLKDVSKFIQEKGYNIPEKYCGLNPTLFIVMR